MKINARQTIKKCGNIIGAAQAILSVSNWTKTDFFLLKSFKFGQFVPQKDT